MTRRPDSPASTGTQVAAPAQPTGQSRAASPAAPQGFWAAKVSSASRLLRRHWLAAALLTVGLVLRVLVQLAYRPALFYIDTARYLDDAMGNDPVGYKGPLRAILAVANFNAVAAVQHLIGMGMAVLIYLLLLRRGCARWLAAMAMAPILLDAYQLQNEQSIMPGTWFEALILVGLAVLLWRPEAGYRRIAIAGIVLGTSATFAQVGEAMLVPAVIYLMVLGGGWRRALLRAVAMCAAFALPVLAYCTGSYLMTGDFFLSHTGVTSFYGRAAAAANCATLRLPQAVQAMCPTKAQQAQGPDWLEYNRKSPIRPYYKDPSRRAQANSEIASFNHAVLVQQPQRLLAAYGRDLLKLFALTRQTSQGDTPISRWQFQRSYPYFSSQTTKPDVITAVDRFGGGRPAVWRPVAAMLRSYQLGGGYTPGPVYALCALAGLAGSVIALRRRTDQVGSPVREIALACLLFFGSAVFVLAVSDTFEFSWRYQLPALVTLVPAGALGVAAVIRTMRARRSTDERFVAD